MEGQLLGGKLGEDGKYEVKFEGGKLKANAEYAAGPVSGKAEVQLDSDAVLDAIAAKIPGQWDDVALNALKALLKA